MVGDGDDVISGSQITVTIDIKTLFAITQKFGSCRICRGCFEGALEPDAAIKIEILVEFVLPFDDAAVGALAPIEDARAAEGVNRPADVGVAVVGVSAFNG